MASSWDHSLDEDEEAAKRKMLFLRQIKQKARCNAARSTLKKNQWTISPQPRMVESKIGSDAPSSTKYTPNLDLTRERPRGARIQPPPKHERREKKGDENDTSKLLSMTSFDDKPKTTPFANKPKQEDDLLSRDCTWTPNLSKEFLLRRPSPSKSPSIEPGPLISKTRRRLELSVSSATPAPGEYEAKPGVGERVRGGKLSTLERFKSTGFEGDTAPGPGAYTPSVGATGSSNNRGVDFSKMGKVSRGMVNERRAARLPGPGAYRVPSSFEDHSHDVSMVAAGFFKERIAFDKSAFSPALMKDIRFVRGVSHDLHRMQLADNARAARDAFDP